MPQRCIFHIAARDEFEAGMAAGRYAPAAFEREGFIHCSYAEQVCAVADRLYGKESDLVLLEIDPGLTNCRVIDEDLYGSGQAYPHIYGKLVPEAIKAVHSFPGPVETGEPHFRLPAALVT